MLGGYRRTAADRGRGQAAPLRADGLAAILATAARPRTDGRGVESHTTAHRRGRLDAVIAGLLFMGGLRRSEVAALRWADVTDASDGDGVPGFPFCLPRMTIYIPESRLPVTARIGSVGDMVVRSTCREIRQK